MKLPAGSAGGFSLPSQGKAPGAPTTILSRSTQSYQKNLTATQSQADEMVSSFVDQATEWKSLASMMAGGLAFQYGKIGALSSLTRATGRLPIPSALIRGSSFAFGLASEVTAFEFTNRSLHTFWVSAADTAITDVANKGEITLLIFMKASDGKRQLQVKRMHAALRDKCAQFIAIGHVRRPGLENASRHSLPYC